METLEALDRSIVLWINGLNTPFLDEFMWMVSGKLTWIPLYLLLLFLFARKYGRMKALWFLLLVVVGVTLSDQISVHLFKDMFLRYRPSHHAELTGKLHFHDLGGGNPYKGGMYGFVSSHAANFMVVCLMSLLALRKSYKWVVPVLVISYTLVCFSRIYLGVHYLSDVLVGGLVGAVIALLMHRFGVRRLLKTENT